MSISAAFSAAYENSRQAQLLIKQLRAELTLARKESADRKGLLAAEERINRNQQETIKRLEPAVCHWQHEVGKRASQIARLTEERDRLQEAKDAAYLERNQCVALIASMALSLSWTAGRTRTVIEGWSPEWHGCVYIDLPAGQVSWHYHDLQSYLFEHLPELPDGYAWDGHDTEEKYERVNEQARMTASGKAIGVAFAAPETAAERDRLRGRMEKLRWMVQSGYPRTNILEEFDAAIATKEPTDAG